MYSCVSVCMIAKNFPNYNRRDSRVLVHCVHVRGEQMPREPSCVVRDPLASPPNFVTSSSSTTSSFFYPIPSPCCAAPLITPSRRIGGRTWSVRARLSSPRARGSEGRAWPSRENSRREPPVSKLKMRIHLADPLKNPHASDENTFAKFDSRKERWSGETQRERWAPVDPDVYPFLRECFA